MSNDPASGGEQPGWQGQQPYPGGYGQPGDQPPYPGSSYPPPGQQPAGYGQAPPPWATQGPGQPGQPGGQRGSGWPAPGQHGPAGLGSGGPSPQHDAQSFSGALFDFGFNTFATPVVIKVLYILSLVGIGLFYVFAVISGFSQGAVTGLIALVVGGVLALLSLIYTRVILELLYAVVRIAEDVRLLRNRP
jgi:Domain of unknown function (DUF4282)